MSLMTSKTELHHTGLKTVLERRQQQTIKSVVSLFKERFIKENIEDKPTTFWIQQYNELLDRLYDVFAYQPHSNPDLSHVMNVPYALTEVYQQKNTDYGDSFTISMEEFGLYASIVRLSDKINRLAQLTRDDSKQLVADEKVEDTILDAINYAQMTLTYLNAQPANTLTE